jgi:hypothetical protein
LTKGRFIVPRRLLQRLLTIRPQEASFAARGFEVSDPGLSRKLETMLESFIAGYNHAVRISDPVALSEQLYKEFDSHHVGFAFEGIGLWLALVDLLVPGKATRLNDFLKGTGRDHDYIIAVGAGFAIARLPWGPRVMDRYLRTLDPFIAWCVPCGYGFHEGFFNHHRFFERAQEPPRSLSVLGKQLFDSGLGRALWWVECADPIRIKCAIDRFPERRRAELWAGIGIASSYAGGIDAGRLRMLHELAQPCDADFLSGLPFSARLRQKAGNYSEATDLACRVLLGMSTDETADMAEAAAAAVRHQVKGEGITAAYDLVRKHLVTEFSNSHGVKFA